MAKQIRKPHPSHRKQEKEDERTSSSFEKSGKFLQRRTTFCKCTFRAVRNVRYPIHIIQYRRVEQDLQQGKEEA